MAEGDDFGRRLLAAVDVKGYSGNTANWQKRIQEALPLVLDRAGARAGLERAKWEIQDAGDGELAVLPPGEPEPRVVDDYVRHLVAELRRYNRDVPQGKELRLRLALHFGPTMRAAKGFSGGGPVVVSRLCDSPALRIALDQTGAALAVVLSDGVFSETVAQEHTSLDPTAFRKVVVRVKELVQVAWIWVPEKDIGQLDLPDDAVPPTPDPPPRPAAAGPGVVHGHFANAHVRADKVVGGDEITYLGGRP
ncbi:hypothetical protein [Herbidospora mongoliensis]|uniref:hypothetical protein n=1 Tax=Herbidospora mongoliensis TaxID=688067 RepID=UPI0012FC82A9|nr:hypothetical protein [Herbidospora mongoliensis]